MTLSSKDILSLFIGIIICALVYYIYKNDKDEPIHNTGSLKDKSTESYAVQEAEEELVGKVNPNNPDTRKSSDQTDVIDQLITEYTAQGTVSGSGGTFGGYDQTQNNMGDFNVQTKKQLNMNKMESPYSDDIYDSPTISSP